MLSRVKHIADLVGFTPHIQNQDLPGLTISLNTGSVVGVAICVSAFEYALKSDLAWHAAGRDVLGPRNSARRPLYLAIELEGNDLSAWAMRNHAGLVSVAVAALRGLCRLGGRLWLGAVRRLPWQAGVSV